MRKKRIAIITGASSGLGEAFARQLAARDIGEFWIIARRAERLAQLARELNGSASGEDANAGLPRFNPLAADIRGRNAGLVVKNLLAESRLRNKQAGWDGIVVDTLVNNAGMGVYGRFDATDAARHLDEIDLNVTALTAITAEALPYMEAGSRIINTASLAAFSAMGGFAVYAAVKAFALNFSLGLAAELEDKGIRVIALCPGSVDTEFSYVASEGLRAKVPHGQSPGAVVRHCLRALERGKKIAVMTPKWRVKAFLPRLFGRAFTAKATMVTEKRPSKDSGSVVGTECCGDGATEQNAANSEPAPPSR